MIGRCAILNFLRDYLIPCINISANRGGLAKQAHSPFLNAIILKGFLSGKFLDYQPIGRPVIEKRVSFTQRIRGGIPVSIRKILRIRM